MSSNNHIHEKTVPPLSRRTTTPVGDGDLDLPEEFYTSPTFDVHKFNHFVLKAKRDTSFQKVLMDIVLASRFDTSFHVHASSRAISILNGSHFNFSGLDICNVVIPGAKMSNSICGNTDFRGADLSNVDFSNSWLVNANFKGAKLYNTNFGEELQVKCSHAIGKLLTYEDNFGRSVLASVCYKENHVHCWNFNNGFELGKFSVGYAYPFSLEWGTRIKVIQYDYLGNGDPEPCLAIWSYEKRVGFLQRDTDWDYRMLAVWNLATRKCLKLINLNQVFQIDHSKDYVQRLYDSFDISEKWILYRSKCELIAHEWTLSEKQKQVRSLLRTAYNVCGRVWCMLQVQFLPDQSSRFVTLYQETQFIDLFEIQSEIIHLTKIEFKTPGIFELQVAFNDGSTRSKFMAIGNTSLQSTLFGITLYNIEAGQTTLLEGHKKRIIALAIDKGGTLLASADDDRNIFIWDIDIADGDGDKISRRLSTISKPIYLHFHPDKPILTSSHSNFAETEVTLKFWKLSGTGTDKTKARADNVLSKNSDSDVGNLIQVALSENLEWMASFHSDNSSVSKGRIGNPDKHDFQLRFWNLSTNSTCNCHVGTFLGYQFPMEFVGSTCHLVLVGVQMAKQHSGHKNINWQSRCEFVALVFDAGKGQVIKKSTMTHSSWAGKLVKEFTNPIFSCTLNMKGRDWQLATSLWDGSIQLWRFTHESCLFKPSTILPAIYYKIPADQTVKSGGYRDPLSTDNVDLVESIPAYWEHVDLFSGSSNDWIISSNIEGTVYIWNVTMEIKPTRNPVYTIHVPPLNGGTPVRPFKIIFEPETKRVYFLSPGYFWVWSMQKNLSGNSKTKCIYKNLSLPLYDLVLINNAASFPWIIAADDKGILHIWDKSNFKILNSVHLWFPIHTIEYYQYRNESIGLALLYVIVGGSYSNLVILEFTLDGSWKIHKVLWSDRQILMAEGLNLNQCISISDWNVGIFNGLNAVGIPAPPAQVYYTQASLLSPCAIAHSSVGQEEEDLSILGNTKFRVSTRVWVVSIVGYQQRRSRKRFNLLKTLQRKFGIRHLFLLLEGILTSDSEDHHQQVHHQRFIVRSDLNLCRTGDRRIIQMYSYKSLSEVKSNLQNIEGLQWEISPDAGRKLIENIRNEQQEHWEYNFVIHNCII